jgi:uncharacterized protein (DUF885 family)
MLLCGIVLLASPVAAQTADARFARLAGQFLDHWLARRPHVATRLGLHATDGLLLPVTQASMVEDTQWLRDFRGRLRAVRRDDLIFDRALEYDVLAARVERELLDFEVIRPYENNPNVYIELVAGSIQSLLQRDFAPLCQRLRSATRRLAQVPEVLRAARVNLRNPPRIYTEIALAQFPGVLQLYRAELPAVAASCRDPRAQGDLAEADSVAVRAAEEFMQYLRDDLLPRSNGSFALGKETYQRKLACDEMETAPVDTLLAQAWRALEETRARMEALAGGIAPGGGVAAALDTLERDAPDGRDLVPFVAGELDRIRAFLRDTKPITMPLREDLIVREMPAFRRGTWFAAMESPGVWERHATEAYYDVTPAESTWTDQQKRDHLGFFNRFTIDFVSIHEALPGHYYQSLALRTMRSRVRQVFGSGTSSEGWAHYCEQMAIEQGFGGGDPRYELAQLELAIQRLGRFVAGISLHTQGMTYGEAVRLFEERCYLSPVNAEREARRCVIEPTCLVYTLGKWRILDLRDEVRRRMGPRFKLRDFHDAFLRQGASPLPVVRAGLLRDLGLEGR